MKVGVIGVAEGVHEARFLRAFRERGVEAIFISFDELAQPSCGEGRQLELEEVDFYFGGPLHEGLRIASRLEGLPFIAVSYAYDVLHEAKLDSQAAEGVRRLLGMSAGLLVDCEAVAKAAKEIFGYAGRMLVRAWGLERTASSLVGCGTSEAVGLEEFSAGPRILSLRNFSELHGVMDVVRAFGHAATRDSALRLLLAGDGPLKAQIGELIEDLGLAERVSLLGRIPESEIIGLIQRADVYVSASVVDGTSISLLQALDAGVPVLLSNVGGNPEWVERVEGAVLFEPGNWQQLGDCMLAATRQGPTRRFNRSAALARHADWMLNADAIVGFCLQAIG